MIRVSIRVAISIRNPGTVVTIRVSSRVAIRVAISIRNPGTMVTSRFQPGFDQSCEQGCNFDSKPWNGGYDQGFDQGCDQGCDFDSKPWDDGDDQVLTRVATRVANHNPESQPETPRFRFLLAILQP